VSFNEKHMLNPKTLCPICSIIEFDQGLSPKLVNLPAQNIIKLWLWLLYL